MSDHKFKIPVEFQEQVTVTGPKDKRTDEEILKPLGHFQPVISEKNVWCYWHSGLSNLPGWCKRNIIDWARINGLSWTIRILDTVPGSPNHVLKYVPEDMLPEALVKNALDGPYKGPHAADMLRGACLYLHGGVYMDVGIILIRELDRIGWEQLSDPENPKQVCIPWYHGTLPANHWVAARKGDPFIKRWHDLFVHLWANKTNYNGLGANPLLAFAANMDFSESEKKGFKWEFVVGPDVVFQYITQCLAWARVSSLEEPGKDGFNGAEYQRDHVLYYYVLPECWPAETNVGFSGKQMFEAMSTRLDADPASSEYQKAYKFVWQALSSASMQKITHGKNLTKTPALGSIWDLPENEGKDVEPGTFVELLRHGAVNFRQTRDTLVYEQVDKPTMTIKKGLFEP
jgi:hypothetical protein